MAIPPYYIKPDFLLIVVVTAGLIKGPRFGVGIGFVAGTLQDLFLGGMFGVLSLVKMLIGGAAGLAEGAFFKENYLMPPVVVFITTIIHDMLKILLSEELLFNLNIWLVLKDYIVPEAIFNSLLGFVLYFIIYRLDNSGGSYHG